MEIGFVFANIVILGLLLLLLAGFVVSLKRIIENVKQKKSFLWDLFVLGVTIVFTVFLFVSYMGGLVLHSLL